MATISSSLGRALRGLWWLLDAGRRALMNLLLLGLLVLLVWALLRGGAPALQPKTALVLDLSGRIAEQRAGATRDTALEQLRGRGEAQQRLRDVLAVLDAAAKDEKISHALLMLDDLSGAGLPTLREVAAALDRFKAAGKPVFAWGSAYDQRQYFLAAHASEVWLHPMGDVLVEGYGRYRNYYKDLLDRVGVSANVIRVGKFKNANEAYAASAPSPETLASDGALYKSLWTSWTTEVEKARKQPAGSVDEAIASLPDSLVAAGGDAARWALQRKWVDALKTRDEMRATLIERGARDDDAKTFRQVSFDDYLGRIKTRSDGDAVAVVVAEGGISDGRAGPGAIGGLSTAELVRKAREDDRIKALVLRVDSPGGSAFGSELVRRELELTRQAGKPVVVSMGDVAASGGYWISLAADEMIADEATVTGSIGVIAMLPTAPDLLDKLGVHTGGVTTTWLAGAYDPRRPLDPRFAQMVQASIGHIYSDFTAHAAAARKTTPEKIDSVGQGRVWSGRDALALGLVDRLGSLGDALKSAATRAKLPEGYRVQYVEVEPGRLQRWLERLGVGAALNGASGLLAGTAAPNRLQALQALQALGLAAPSSTSVAQDLGWLADVAARRQPWAAAAHCLCEAP
jgi:protease-4